MKGFRSIIIFLAAAAVSSCSLELQPKGIIDESILMNSDFGVQKYFTILYNDLPIEDFNYRACGDTDLGYGSYNQIGYHHGNIWQPMKGYGSVISGDTSGRGYWNISGAFGYWPYERIRDCNIFLRDFPAYKDNFTEETFQRYIAEARFLRAYYYFGLVKRYGGIPIIDTVQDVTASKEVLQVPRDTEYDCWMFIHDDLAFAMEHLSADRSMKSRANRYTAAALMSKAMLYAGSVARYNSSIGMYGEASAQGFLGMRSDKAEAFFQAAYDACKMIHDAGYTLHDGADKVKSYREVFIEDCPEEDIFVKRYDESHKSADDKMNMCHSYDCWVLPLGQGLSSQVGGAVSATWDLLSMYEIPAVEDAVGKPVRFSSMEDFWGSDEMEARAKANFLFDGQAEPASGTVLDIRAGVYTSYPGTVADGCPNPNVENDYTLQYRWRSNTKGSRQVVAPYGEVEISGEHGIAFNPMADEGPNQTGIVVYKYVNYNADLATRIYFGSHQSFKVFRYGAILLDWAEAAYELGLAKNDASLKAEAFDHINEIRDRAGAKPHAMIPAPLDIGSERYGYVLDENLQFIRDERRRELFMENITDWDMRRWRVLHTTYQSWPFHDLYPYKVLDEDKYILLPEYNRQNIRLVYDQRWYYEDIPAAEIARNPNLIHNDGY